MIKYRKYCVTKIQNNILFLKQHKVMLTSKTNKKKSFNKLNRLNGNEQHRFEIQKCSP